MDFQRSLKQQRALEVMNDYRRRFVKSASKFIMVVYTYGRQEIQKGRLNKLDFRSYLNEIVHCIFFLGQLQQPSVDPECMFPSKRALSAMRSLTAFTSFRSHTPKRMPGSVLLQMVEQIEGSNSQQEILKTLALLGTDMLVNDAGGGGGEDDGGDDGSGGDAVLNVFSPVGVKSLVYGEGSSGRYAWGASIGNLRPNAARAARALGRLFYLNPLVVGAMCGTRGESCFLVFHRGIRCTSYTCHMEGGCVRFRPDATMAAARYWTGFTRGALSCGRAVAGVTGEDWAACEALRNLLALPDGQIGVTCLGKPASRQGETELSLNALVGNGPGDNGSLVPFDPSAPL
ncbi:uncharacterized protein LOC144936130 isoform X1 [Lampetra fluviatilis]